MWVICGKKTKPSLCCVLGKATVIHNHGSVDPKTPGKMVESLGPVSPPYWVLNLWGDYEYSLVYACVDLVVTKSEYVYFFGRNSSIPANIMADMRASCEGVLAVGPHEAARARICP